jgi:hypothetical protein
MISKAQITLLHVAKTRLGLEDEMYRAILREQGGVDSSTQLTNANFDRVMKRFEELGFVNTAKRPRWRTAQPKGLVTPAQQGLIRGLYEQLGWSDVARQIGFSKRVCKKSFPQTRGDANKVIEALKAMIKREESR